MDNTKGNSDNIYSTIDENQLDQLPIYVTVIEKDGTRPDHDAPKETVKLPCNKVSVSRRNIKRGQKLGFTITLLFAGVILTGVILTQHTTQINQLNNRNVTMVTHNYTKYSIFGMYYNGSVHTTNQTNNSTESSCTTNEVHTTPLSTTQKKRKKKNKKNIKTHRKPKPNTDLKGYHLYQSKLKRYQHRTYNRMSLNKCADLCSKHHNCKGFEYKYDRCYLVMNRLSRNQVVSTHSGTLIYEKKEQYHYSLHEGYKCLDGKILGKHGKLEDVFIVNCAAHCYNYSRCIFFTAWKRRTLFTCYFFSSCDPVRINSSETYVGNNVNVYLYSSYS